MKPTKKGVLMCSILEKPINFGCTELKCVLNWKISRMPWRIVSKHAENLRKRKWMHWAPPSIRFVAPSKAHLSMTNNQVSAFIEMGIFAGANGAQELMESYERMFIEKYNARPTLGPGYEYTYQYRSG